MFGQRIFLNLRLNIKKNEKENDLFEVMSSSLKKLDSFGIKFNFFSPSKSF